jgi:hypothetical protein
MIAPMATPLRPLPPASTLGPSAAPASGRVRSPEALAAQRAFFAAALGQAAPPVAAAPRTVAEISTPVQPVQSAPVQPRPAGNGDAPPSRNLRPGSLIDIKV